MNWTPSQPLPSAFKAVPARVYENDPHWMPEDGGQLDRLFSADHPYFARGTATVAVDNGTARLAGLLHPDARIYGRKTAFFGFWETLDDVEVNKRLFSNIEQWAAARGAAYLLGPVNFCTHRSYRIRTQAPAGTGSFPGEPYNPPYYKSLLGTLGYTQAATYLSLENDQSYEQFADDVLRQKSGFLQTPSPGAPTIERLTPEFWMEHLDELYPLVDAIFQENLAYTRPSPETFRSICGRPFARLLCPKTSLLARNSEGTVIGFFVTFPNYAPLLRQGNPNRLPLCRLRYEEHFEQLARPVLLAKTLGVHPAYRQQGLLNRMATEALRRSVDHYDGVIICLMKEDNPSLRYGAPFTDRYRRYALYGKSLQ